MKDKLLLWREAVAYWSRPRDQHVPVRVPVPRKTRRVKGHKVLPLASNTGIVMTDASSCKTTNFFNEYDRLDYPPEHHWYQCSRPGGYLAHGFNRQEQTIQARFRSGHLKSVKFSKGSKSFEMCTNCSEPASPAHILECLGLTKQDLADDPLLELDFLRVCDVMDLV
ncbi:uncharacterized protein TNCV_4236481 [Trichonephila clavipes]|nr:uncharacterized protein TNCV_4236481 [Trichonephila clavipes]